MITKSAYNTDNCKLGLMFTKNARTAWSNIISSLCSNRKLTLLLPAYIGRNDKEGSGVYDPVLKYQTNSEFYKVCNQLSVDLESFEKKIKTGSIDVALVIHYFGFCRTNMNKIKKICKENSVVLVEDCAHAFHLGASNQLIGNYGDFSFYSIHKYLATNNGGVWKRNTNSFQLAELKQEELADYEVLQSYANSDFRQISEIRRDNFRAYSELLVSNDNFEIMYELTSEDIPQTFPIRVKNNLREKLYFFLMEKGLPTTALYYRMIEQISLIDFPLSIKISNEILNLPVHQDINFDDIKNLCQKIDEFFKKDFGS